MRIKKTALSAAVIALWLVVWQIGAMLINRDLLIPIPTPLTTLAALWQEGANLHFWLIAGASLLRICVGFAAAVVIGSVCAFFSSRLTWFRILTAPLIKVVRSVPVASFIILVFLWLSKGEIPSFIAFLTVCPIVWANVETGFLTTDRQMVEMARVMGLSNLQIITQITLPGVKPYFVASVATGLGFAWKAGVAAEVICRTEFSLGDLLWAEKSAINYDGVFALTVVVVALSVLLESGVKALLKGGERHDTV